MNNTPKEIQEKWIEAIKDCGQSLIDNAEKIAGDYKFQTEYYSAAEPPVRCSVSHLSGLTEPPVYSYSA